ncbi:MAG: single-stranded DNA-binding protein, partial [Candidatus Eremiobacteraeota bacterium]|nr:single-stranded DNA-binding protein [Candidatus Eremiobacteraeota bacterium]
MAGSYNRIILVGNLTRDPEIRYTQTSKSVTKFTLAVNNPRNKEETTFVDIVAWDRLGETCNTYLKKGQSCLVEGRLVIRSYDDKDGNKRKATEVVIDNMQMLGSPRDRSASGDDAGGYNGGLAPAASRASTGGDAFGEDLEDE